MAKIKKVRGQEILDSRGNPTVAVKVWLDSGVTATAMVPSGASTGIHEAVELRDADAKRYLGKGVLKAVENVNTSLAELVIGMEAGEQKVLDDAMIAFDGTENKGRMGANAVLGISLAVARAHALDNNIPLYQHINNLLANEQNQALPIPMFNVLNGGVHSDSGLSVQEFMLVPHGIKVYHDQLRAGAEVFHTLKKLLDKDGFVTSVGDEGGFAPKLSSHEQVFDYIIKAVDVAGYKIGEDISIALDTASSEFYDTKAKLYKLQPENENLTNTQLIEKYQSWVDKYHLISIEDGLSEDDWEGWTEMKQELESVKDFNLSSHPAQINSKFMLVGDDLLVTNPKRLTRAIEEKSCNAILIKVNQIGTLTETLDCIRMAQANDIRVVVSHRSGETTDDFIADLAVGTGAEFIKTGSLSRGERLVKYNRLLEVENEVI